MNQYETVFILTPVLSDEQMKETAAKFKKVLTDKGAEILNVIRFQTVKLDKYAVEYAEKRRAKLGKKEEA